MRIPVFVQSWQLQCCGQAFGVGAAVDWRLTTDSDGFVRRALGSRAPTWCARLPVIAAASGSVVSGSVVGTGGLRVFIDHDTDPPPVEPDGVRLEMLVEDHHIGVPEDLTPTHGQVRRIERVCFGYERDSEQAPWRLRPGDAILIDVAHADTWPAETDDGRSFAGYLVELDVED